MAHTPDPSSKAALVRPPTFNSPADDILARARAAGLVVDGGDERTPPSLDRAPERPKPAPPAPSTKRATKPVAPIVAAPVPAKEKETPKPVPARHARVLPKKAAPVIARSAPMKAYPPPPKPEAQRRPVVARLAPPPGVDHAAEARMADAIERMVEERVNAVLQTTLKALFGE